MKTNSPQFLFVGTNSQVLESYRRNLSEFLVQVASPKGLVEDLNGGKISSLESLAALFIDVEQLDGLENRSELSKISSLLPQEVPIIVISAVAKEGVRALNPRFRVLKKPLQPGELLHEAKNVITHRNYVAQSIHSERLAAIRSVLGGVSHELGNIILRIAAKADLALIAIEGDDTAATHRHVEGVVEAAQKASKLVKNLQSFAKTRPHFASGKLSTSIDEALRRLETTISQQKIVVQKKWQFEKGEPDLVFDNQVMTQAFFNLFENAVIAMPEGGILNIEMQLKKAPAEAGGTQLQPTLMVIQIQDSGTGMTPDVLKRAFDFAYSTRKQEASGLGLPVARELVRSHGGELELKSEPKQGTEISIWLPVRPC